jgi:hypothetical protein
MATTATLPLGPATVNITGVRAGDKNQFTLSLTNEGAPLPLTGTVTAQARKVATDPDPAAITAVVDVIDGPGGVVSVRWPGDEVNAALAGQLTWAGVWDLQVTEGTDDPVTLVAGTFAAVMDVTRP